MCKNCVKITYRYRRGLAGWVKKKEILTPLSLRGRITFL
jgi:hypothetical protein